jgi:hypothetical protein
MHAQHTAIQLCRARGSEKERLEGKLRKHLRTKRHLVRHVQGPGGMHPANPSAEEVDSEEDTELDLSAILPMEQPAVRRMVQAFQSSNSDSVGGGSDDMMDDDEHGSTSDVRDSRARSYSGEQLQQQQQQQQQPQQQQSAHSRSLVFGSMLAQPSAAQLQQQQQQQRLQQHQQWQLQLQQPLQRQLFQYPALQPVSLHAPVVVQQQRSSGSIVGGGLATHTHQFPVSVASVDAQQQQYYPSMLPGSANHVRTLSSSSSSSASMRTMQFTECGNGAESPSSDDDTCHFEEQNEEQKDSRSGESPWAAAVRSADQHSADQRSAGSAAAAAAAVVATAQQQQQQVAEV